MSSYTNENRDTSNETVGQKVDRNKDWAREKGQDAKENMRQGAYNAADSVQDTAQHAKERLDGQRRPEDNETIGDKVDKVKDWFKEKGQEIKETFRGNTKDAADSVERSAQRTKDQIDEDRARDYNVGLENRSHRSGSDNREYYHSSYMDRDRALDRERALERERHSHDSRNTHAGAGYSSSSFNSRMDSRDYDRETVGQKVDRTRDQLDPDPERDETAMDKVGQVFNKGVEHVQDGVGWVGKQIEDTAKPPEDSMMNKTGEAVGKVVEGVQDNIAWVGEKLQKKSDNNEIEEDYKVRPPEERRDFDRDLPRESDLNRSKYDARGRY